MTQCDLYDHDFHHGHEQGLLAVILAAQTSNDWKPEAVKVLLDGIGHWVHGNVEVQLQ